MWRAVDESAGVLVMNKSQPDLIEVAAEGQSLRC